MKDKCCNLVRKSPKKIIAFLKSKIKALRIKK
jgi:hypothetical protein